MIGISDKKGIPDPKLEHIFWGTVKGNGNIVSGYHCNKNFGDEKVYAEAHLYPKSKRIITLNRNQKIFEAVVRSKESKVLKSANGGKSTFYNNSWSRQDVVDCIARLEGSEKLIKKYGGYSKVRGKEICIDKTTGLVVVNARGTAFPILKY